MPVITIAQSKGGAGKTTLALALASEFEALGGSVFMLDADRQNSLLNWHRDRREEGRGGDSLITVEDASQIRDAEIGAAIKRARESAQLVIVDSEGPAPRASTSKEPSKPAKCCRRWAAGCHTECSLPKLDRSHARAPSGKSTRKSAVHCRYSRNKCTRSMRSAPCQISA